MDIDDLEIGMIVKIIVWEDHRPEHWSGDMDEWQGAVVTISDYEHKSEYVFIEEDEGEWQWFPWDFESCHVLSENNPNRLYKSHKEQAFFAKLRAKYQPTVKKS